MPWQMKGIIEGFYGRPWTWEERVELCQWCAAQGMTDYLYAPKDDLLHRQQWRDLYPQDWLADFRRFTERAGVRVGFAISPGLSIDYHSSTDRDALLTKISQVLDQGVKVVGLLLDDIDVRPGLGEDHADLTAWLRDALPDDCLLLLTPTIYTGVEPTPYLDALARGVPPEVPIAWTGWTVVTDQITATEARLRAAALGGRPPLVWDNYPANDMIMADRLHLGPLRGRDPLLVEACWGYLANPMNQPRASRPPLASIAAWLNGQDPLEGWAREAGPHVVFAEACDGVRPVELVEELASAVDERSGHWPASGRRLVSWLDRLADGPDPTGEFGDEVQPWIDQIAKEAGCCSSAVRLIQAAHPVATLDHQGNGRVAASDGDAATLQGFGLMLTWPDARRGVVTAFGSRGSFRPVLAQSSEGDWRMRSGSLDQSENSTDRLVRLTFGLLDCCDDSIPEVFCGDRRLEVAPDGGFSAPPGQTITLQGRVLRTSVEPGTPLPYDDARLGPTGPKPAQP